MLPCNQRYQFSISASEEASARARKLSRKSTRLETNFEMHAPDYSPTNNSFAQLNVHFSDYQSAPVERNLGNLIAQKIAQREFFYGIEVSARSNGPNATILDYNSFGALLPLFTSLIWLGQDYCCIDRIENVESIRLAQQLLPKSVVMPHFTCYRTDEQRLSEMLALNFTNILALRGDQVESEQSYKYSSELVSQMKRVRGDTISIGVGGYPELHPDSKSLEEDLQFLLKKVNAGADFIITQICFSAEAVIQFVRNCRANGITVPIMMGMFIPDNMRILQRMVEITKVQVPPADYAEYEARSDDRNAFREFSVQKAVQQITTVLKSNSEIYGIQFFSMNQFKNIQLVLAELSKMNFGNKNQS